MIRDDEQFEDSIRHGLSRLADEAPPGPAGEMIVQALRRRRLRRRSLAGAAACLAAVTAAVVLALTILGPGPAPRTIARGQGDGAVAGVKKMTDQEIRETIMREARAGSLVAATEILAEAPGSQEDVRKMRQFILSEYAGTKAAQTLVRLSPPK